MGRVGLTFVVVAGIVDVLAGVPVAAVKFGTEERDFIRRTT